MRTMTCDSTYSYDGEEHVFDLVDGEGRVSISDPDGGITVELPDGSAYEFQLQKRMYQGTFPVVGCPLDVPQKATEMLNAVTYCVPYAVETPETL